MATIAENMKPVNVANGQMSSQAAPPQSPNTFLNMLTQNPAAMENVRERFQNVFGTVASNDVDLPLANSLAADIGNAIEGFDGIRGYPAFEGGTGEFPVGLSLAPLDIQDIEVLTGQSVAKPEVEEQFRREGQQQVGARLTVYASIADLKNAQRNLYSHHIAFITHYYIH